MEGKTVLRAYRVRIEPTAEQRRELARCVGTARAAYNWALAEWRRQYRAYRLAERAPARAMALLIRWGSPLAADPRWSAPPGKKPNAFALHKLLTSIKREKFPWMTEVPALVVREAVADVGAAYEHFFRRLKAGEVGRAAGEPRFRSRHGGHSFHLDQGDALGARRGGDFPAIKLPVIGWVRVHKRQARYLPEDARLIGVGISEHLGHWYAAVRAEVAAPRPRKPRIDGKRLGVEVGVRSLVVTSDGGRVGAMRDLDRAKSAERRLAMWQRRAARRYRAGIPTREQSAGWREAQEHVRRIYAEISRTRDELLHYASRRVVDSGASVVIMRKPGVQKMISRVGKSREAARSRNAIAPMVSKIGWYELRRKIEYKQGWADGTFIEAPSELPSTRTCSVCGVVRDSDPGYPSFRCSSCGHQEDREANSAKVLRDFAPPSGGSKGGDGTRRRKTGRKTGTTAARTATPGAAGQPATDGADGAGASPGTLGSGNGTSGQPDGTGRVISDPTRPEGEPSARFRFPFEQRGGARSRDQEHQALASPADGPSGDRSQDDAYPRGFPDGRA